MKKLFLLLVTALTVSLCASAQMRTVTGTVIEEATGEPLIGASVTPDGSNMGVVTDLDGNFAIQVGAQVRFLHVSHVGFKSQKVAITGKPLEIALKHEAESLGEIIVTAYGTTKKAEYTGSAGVVKAEALEDALVSNVTKALDGRIAGVQTLSSNGQPGTSASVLIRGVGSINGSTDPLYVVDGMPYDGSINAIATSDIESMTVLKDAASTALYGARGANGVILITTKKGQSGNARVTLDMRWGSNSRALSNYDVITNPEQYLETLYQSMYMTNLMDHYVAGGDNTAAKLAAHNYANSNIWGAMGQQTFSVPAGQFLIGYDGKINPNATRGYSDGNYYYTPDDWTKETFNNGLRQEYNLSIVGGTNSLNYYVGGSYLGDAGIISGSHFKRFSARTNVDYQAKKWLKIGTNTSYTYSNTGSPSAQTNRNSNSAANAFAVANKIAPIFPIYVRDAQGNIMYNEVYNQPIYDYGMNTDYGHGRIAQRASGAWAAANPKGMLIYDRSDYLADALDTKWYAIITPVEGLTISTTAGYYVDTERAHIVDNSLYGESAETGGLIQQASNRYRTINLQGLATYQRTFNKVNNAELMIGFESQDYNEEFVSGEGKNLYNPSNWTLDNAIDQRRSYGSMGELSHRSGFAHAKYNYDSKYYFMASFRRDGSSAFAPEHRWGSFWSLSAAWDMKKESWLRDVTAVDLLKLKASFGQNGNDRIYNGTLMMAYLDFYEMTGADGIFSDSALAYKGNRDITWEKSNNFNVGTDFSFFNGRLDGSFEYYSRQTKDMLMQLPVPPSLGYSSYPANVGSMRNYGFELELNGRLIDTKDVTLDVFANATFPKNKIISLSDNLLNKDGAWEYSATRLLVPGKGLYTRWMVDYAGVNEEGLALYTALRDKWYASAPANSYANEYEPYTVDGQEGFKRWTGKYEQNYKGQYLSEAGEVIVPAEGETLEKALQNRGVKVYDTEEYNTTDYTTARNTNRKLTDNLMPKMYGGFGFSLQAYGFDLSMQFGYQVGGKIFDTTYQDFMNPGSDKYLGKTWHKDMLNAWTPDNTVTDVPRMANQGAAQTDGAQTSTRFLISSNYLSLNNITVGYTLPKKVTSALHLNEVRVYGNAENVALWSRRKGLDPRQDFVSSDNNTYSPIRCISGGIKVAF